LSRSWLKAISFSSEGSGMQISCDTLADLSRRERDRSEDR
jgi:hypothetical protein